MNGPSSLGFADSCFQCWFMVVDQVEALVGLLLCATLCVARFLLVGTVGDSSHVRILFFVAAANC